MGRSFKIRLIDRGIDAVRAELKKREHIMPFSAASWQAAWDRHPELRARETELFLLRDDACRYQDRMAEMAYVHATRRQHRKFRKAASKSCPTCGQQMLAA